MLCIVMSTPQIPIVAERQNYIVINKPAGLDCQASRDDRPSLAGWLEDRFGFSGLVHRLDFGTSGLMVCALNSVGAATLTKQMQQGQITRRYAAVAMGIIPEEALTINSLVEDKEASTQLIVKERFANATLLELKLDTGRKHQIRIHLKSIGHPIIGDHLYKQKGSHLLLNRPALHSSHLKINGEEFTAPLPGDILELIQKLRKSNIDRNM